MLDPERKRLLIAFTVELVAYLNPDCKIINIYSDLRACRGVMSAIKGENNKNSCF